MALTHVCMWDEKAGYRRVSVEEASTLYENSGVSARSGLFVCELCAQNVCFTAPGVNARHFRHDSAAQNKDCEERQQIYARAITSLGSHPMPVRIKIHDYRMRFELGFFCPNTADFSRRELYRIKIHGSQDFEYSSERIEHSGITYLSVGNDPSYKYEIEYVNLSDRITKYWPSEVTGVSSKGTFFEEASGRMLRPGAKASTKKSYYLLQKRMLWDTPSGILKRLIMEHQSAASGRWYLYKIDVKEFSESVARFFLERSIFLSESPTDFYPIWPPYAEDPYFIYHNEPGLYFFMRGEQAELKTYPITRDHFAPKSRNVEGGKLYKIYATSKEQLLSLGLSGAIGFSYLMRKELKMTASLPKVSIEDINGIVLDQEIYNILPKSKLITITVPYDGKVVYRRNGKITAINLITSDQRLTVDRISYGTEVQIFQGCDCIRKIRFEEEKYGCDKLNADIELARRLKACTGVLVQIPHSMASVAAEFSDFPETRQWISSMIKQGEMPRTAFNILRNYIL